MAMMITRFHKLIQSKVVWYIILGVVIIAFVGFFTPTMRSGGRTQKVTPAGKLNGKKVSREEFSRAYNHVYVWTIISSGRMITMTDELRDLLYKESWKRIAVLRQAQDQNILVTDDEVVQMIQSIPLFKGETGAFDKKMYHAVLSKVDLSISQAEALFREQIVINKLVSGAVQAALISPYELKKMYSLYTDRFVLDYVIIPRSQVEKKITVSKEAAQALFNENPENFRMDAKVRVSFVEFVVSNFLASVELPEGAVQQAYDQNIEQFRVETTNELDAVTYKPFEQVEGEITERLRMDFARKLAAEKATEFVVDVAPKADGAKPDFAGAAASAKLKVKTMAAFSMDDTLKGIDPTAPFRQAAFGLEDDAFTSFSDAVVGKDSVYVLSLEQKYPSFIPAYEAVESDVMERARRQAVAKALAERAAEVQEAVAKATEKQVGFKAVVSPFGLTVKTTPEFDISTELDDPNAETLKKICSGVKQGALCEMAPVDEGVLLAYVSVRKPSDIPLETSEIRESLADWLSSTTAKKLAAEWQDSLLTQGNFEDLLEK